MSELLVRRFNKKDVDKVYNLIRSALSIPIINKIYEKNTLNSWSDVYSKQYILGTSLLRHFYVAELDNDIVGTCTIHKEGNKGYISCVYVNPKIQGKGIGKYLIQAVLKDEVCDQVDSVYLHAVLSAVKFYQKMGFNFIEEIPEIIIDSGVEVVYMEKSLL